MINAICYISSMEKPNFSGKESYAESIKAAVEQLRLQAEKINAMDLDRLVGWMAL